MCIPTCTSLIVVRSVRSFGLMDVSSYRLFFLQSVALGDWSALRLCLVFQRVSNVLMDSLPLLCWRIVCCRRCSMVSFVGTHAHVNTALALHCEKYDMPRGYAKCEFAMLTSSSD